MDKTKILEGILTTRLLSGDLAAFMTELLQLNITPSEARTMDIFGEPQVGELVAKVLETKDDAEAYKVALADLRDFLAASSDVTAKKEPEAAPVKAEEEIKAEGAQDRLEKNADDAMIKPEEIAVPEVKAPEDVDLKALFSSLQETLTEAVGDMKKIAEEMKEALVEHTKELQVPDLKDTDVEQKNFSEGGDDAPAETEIETPAEEGEDMDKEMRDKEFDILREMVFDLMPADKKEAWAKKYAEVMGKDVCPECGDAKEEFCDKTFDDEPKAEEAHEEKLEEVKDDLKESLVDLLDALKDFRDELKKEDEPAEEPKEEAHEDEEKSEEEPKEEPKKDEGLTEDEIKAIEDESANFSANKPASFDVYNYLYGEN